MQMGLLDWAWGDSDDDAAKEQGNRGEDTADTGGGSYGTDSNSGDDGGKDDDGDDD